MCTCEFCHTDYVPIPQVKNPRACQACQKLRQRSNEKAWKKKHLEFSGGTYDRIRRDQRKTKLLVIARGLAHCIEVGGHLLGTALAMEELTDELAEFVLSLGIKRANKFWIDTNAVKSKAFAQ